MPSTKNPWIAARADRSSKPTGILFSGCGGDCDVCTAASAHRVFLSIEPRIGSLCRYQHCLLAVVCPCSPAQHAIVLTHTTDPARVRIYSTIPITFVIVEWQSRCSACEQRDSRMLSAMFTSLHCGGLACHLDPQQFSFVSLRPHLPLPNGRLSIIDGPL